MRHLKEKPIIYESDLMEIYDRAKMVLLDLMGIAADKKVDMTINITESGEISLMLAEHCIDKDFYKRLSQSANGRFEISKVEEKRMF